MDRDDAAAVAVFALLVSVLLGVSLQAESTQGLELPEGYQLLENPSLEEYGVPYGQWYGVDCQVASAWTAFSTGEQDPCWMDTRVFADSWLGSGWVECIAGSTCQLLVSTGPYRAGLWQQVSGLAPGTGYGFHAALLTIFQSSAQPRSDGTMIKRLGLDPTGGTDPASPSVIWGEPDDTDKVWDVQRRVAAFAESATMTVFIEIDSPLDAGPWPFMNMSFLDSAILAQTPTVIASSPEVSLEPAFTVTWGQVAPAPGGGEFRGVDVQVMDESAGTWQDWQSQTYQTEAEFSGQAGHRYRFRARAWQSYPNGAWLHGPYRSQGDSATLVAGGRLAGLVLSPRGSPVPGATVTVSGTSYLAQTGIDGRFDMGVGSLSGTHQVSVSHPVWSSPPPVTSPAFGLTGTVCLTWTLRPAADRIANGQFERGLEGWSLAGDDGAPPSVVEEPVHSGRGALKLGGGSADSAATGVSQTVVLSDAWEPALALWYRPVVTSSSARFRVVARLSAAGGGHGGPLSATVVLTPPLDCPSWRPLFADLGPARASITGTVRLELRLWTGADGLGAKVYIDEVGLGAMPGGRFRVYLPLTVLAGG